jgi:hypothetical protein
MVAHVKKNIKLVDKKLVHKQNDENVLIYNLRRALPRKIYAEIFEKIIAPQISPEEKEYLDKFYSQEKFIYLLEKQSDLKPFYILHSIPQEIEAKSAIDILKSLRIKDGDQRHLLNYFKRDKKKNLFILKENISETDELNILKILGKFRNWYISDIQKTRISEILEKVENIEKEELFFSNMYVNLTHPFFFEHENEHVPAMMIIEAARQFLIACCHKYGNIPYSGISFILSDMKILFKSYLELNYPIKMVANLNYLKTRSLHSNKEKKYWSEINVDISIYQRNIETTVITYTGKSIKSNLFKTLRRDKVSYTQSPRFLPRYSYKNITIVDVNNNINYFTEILDISFTGFKLKFDTDTSFFDKTLEFENNLYKFYIFFKEIGFIHGDCKNIWYQVKEGCIIAGFHITRIGTNDSDNLKDAIKRFHYVIEEREFL